MATTINATTPLVGISGIRSAVKKLNRFWPNTGSIRLVAPSIRLKEIQAFEVLGWDPDQGDTDIATGHSQTVNFAVVRSNPLAIQYSSPSSFLTGSLTDLELAGSGMQLAKERRTVDFNSYSVGSLPVGWTNVMRQGAWAIIQEAGGNRYVRATSTTSTQHRGGVTYDVEPSHVNLIASVKIRFGAGVNFTEAGLLFRTIGQDASLQAIAVAIRWNFNGLIARRLTSDQSESYIGDVATGVTPITGWWYNLKVWIDGNNIKGKVWRSDQSEPASWTLVGSQSVLPGPGEVGLFHNGRLDAGANEWLDDLSFEDVPTQYKLAGEWISQRHSLAAVDLYSQSVVTWNETTPVGTSVLVECQRDVGAPWLTCVSGEPLPGFEFDDGLRTDNLRFRITLTSSSIYVTPEVWNLQAQFIKLDWDLVAIMIDGEFALGSRNQVSRWGQKVFSGGTTVITYDDIYAQSNSIFWLNVTGDPIIASFLYAGRIIDSIYWFAETDPAFVSDYLSNWYWTTLEDTKKGEALIHWNVIDGEILTLAELQWSLVDFTPATQATGWYWVATQVFNEFVASMLVGEGVVNEFLSSLLVNGYMRNEFVQSLVVQGDKLNEFVASLLAAQEFRYEFLQAGIIGELELLEFKASMVIYGVSNDGAIFVNIIDDDTYQALVDAGVVFS